jgi:hypothetical protein
MVNPNRAATATPSAKPPAPSTARVTMPPSTAAGTPMENPTIALLRVSEPLVIPIPALLREGEYMEPSTNRGSFADLSSEVLFEEVVDWLGALIRATDATLLDEPEEGTAA